MLLLVDNFELLLLRWMKTKKIYACKFFVVLPKRRIYCFLDVIFAATMSNIVLFEDIFVVDKLDPDGKKFDKGTIFKEN